MPSLRICFHDTQGLNNDCLILKKALIAHFDIVCASYSEYALVKNLELDQTKHSSVDITIFLEHIYENFTKISSKNVLIPNIEWLNANDIRLCKYIDLICCKNKQSLNVLQSLFPDKNIVYTGFTSIDRHNSNISKKHDYFLHVKGVSKYKNSQILIDTWLKHPEWPTLVVIGYTHGSLSFNIPFKVSKNIMVYQTKVNESTLQSIMNQCGIHICCSFSEGFGHYINEARSTGAFVITTDGEPMKEFAKSNESCVLIPPYKKMKVNYGEGYLINSNTIERVINSIIHVPGKIILQKGSLNRNHYMKDRDLFITKIQEAIKNIC